MSESNSRDDIIAAMKAKLIKKAISKVYGEIDQNHPVNYREVSGTITTDTGEEKEVKITAVRLGKEGE